MVLKSIEAEIPIVVDFKGVICNPWSHQKEFLCVWLFSFVFFCFALLWLSPSVVPQIVIISFFFLNYLTTIKLTVRENKKKMSQVLQFVFYLV